MTNVVGIGRELFEAVRQVGGEGIVSKRRGSPYRAGESRDWFKAKVFDTGNFVITGYSELGEGRLEAVFIAEERSGELVPAGQVRFGFAGKGLWQALDALRDGTARNRVVPVPPRLQARIKYFGRYKRGYIRDGVILLVRGLR